MVDDTFYEVPDGKVHRVPANANETVACGRSFTGMTPIDAAEVRKIKRRKNPEARLCGKCFPRKG